MCLKYCYETVQREQNKHLEGTFVQEIKVHFNDIISNNNNNGISYLKC